MYNNNMTVSSIHYLDGVCSLVFESDWVRFFMAMVQWCSGVVSILTSVFYHFGPPPLLTIHPLPPYNM